MPEQTLEQVPLVCTPEVSKAIYNELTLCGRVKSDEVLVVGGANWQKNRIVQHLEEKLKELQTQIAKMNDASAKRAAALSARYPEEMDSLGTVKSFIRGGLEEKIGLLQSLIGDLK